MMFACTDGRCKTPGWMRSVLLGAGLYHLSFAVWSIAWPNHWFDWAGIDRPNHPLLWQAVGSTAGVLGLFFLIAAKNPIHHSTVILIGFLKFTLAMLGFSVALLQRDLPLRAGWIVAADLVWWFPFAGILWACLRAQAGVPPTHAEPLDISEAANRYSLSNGKTLAEASESKLLALVFLRHFGCTFTRQILRGLEKIQQEATSHGAELVLVHMLQSGKETEFLGERSGIARIADPRCELYRAFGLGKGGFLELFGPHVWWRGAVAIFHGCGMGHLAGDGLQMPGAFLFRDGKIVSSQRARSAADLPDLPGLFQALPSPARHGTVSA